MWLHRSFGGAQHARAHARAAAVCPRARSPRQSSFAHRHLARAACSQVDTRTGGLYQGRQGVKRPEKRREERSKTDKTDKIRSSHRTAAGGLQHGSQPALPTAPQVALRTQVPCTCLRRCCVGLRRAGLVGRAFGPALHPADAGPREALLLPQWPLARDTWGRA